MKELLKAILSEVHYDELLGLNLVEFNGNFFVIEDEEINEIEEYVNS